MVRRLSAAVAMLALGACGTNETAPAATDSSAGIASLSNGEASLQTPPFTEPVFKMPPAPPKPAALPDSTSLAAITSNFDPGKHHFVWVLPPGIHGKGPWDMKAVVALKGEKQFETKIPLRAEMAKAGSRPEYPAGYEIVRLTNDGSWAEQTAEIEKVIQDLIAKNGRGNGALELSNDLFVAIDAAHRQTYCIDKTPADIRFYLEDETASDLTGIEIEGLAAISQTAVFKACSE